MTTFTPENPSFAAARLLVDEAARTGITDVMIAPGSRSTALALACYNDTRITVHTQLDERSAAFYALGYAKVTGRVMPVVVTSGSAVAHLHPAVIEADTAGVPLLIVSADRPAELRDTGANQTIRQADLFGSAVRLTTHVEVLTDAPHTNRYMRSVVQHAFAAAHGGAQRPGPVQLNVAFREPTVPKTDDGRAAVAEPWQRPLHGRDDNQPFVTLTAGDRHPDPQAVAWFVAEMAGLSGVIVAGAIDVTSDDDTLIAAVDRLAGALDWPVFAEASSPLRRASSAVAYVGPMLAASSELPAPQVVLRLGRTGITPGIDAFVRAAQFDVLVDPYGSVFDPDRHVTHRMVADLPQFVAAVERELPRVTPGADRAFPCAVRDAEARLGAAFTRELPVADSDGLTEPATLITLGTALDATDMLVVGSSMPIRDLDAYGPSRIAVPIVTNRGASGVDGFVSTTLGVACARQRFTVGVCGDVTLLHDINGLLADAGDTPVALVVIDNNGGAIFSFLPQAAYPDALRDVFTMPHNRDVTAIAAGYGARTMTVRTAGALREALTAARKHAGVTVIRVPSDTEQNVAVHRTLTQAAATALR